MVVHSCADEGIEEEAGDWKYLSATSTYQREECRGNFGVNLFLDFSLIMGI